MIILPLVDSGSGWVGKTSVVEMASEPFQRMAIPAMLC